MPRNHVGVYRARYAEGTKLESNWSIIASSTSLLMASKPILEYRPHEVPMRVEPSYELPRLILLLRVFADHISGPI